MNIKEREHLNNIIKTKCDEVQNLKESIKTLKDVNERLRCELNTYNINTNKESRDWEMKLKESEKKIESLKIELNRAQKEIEIQIATKENVCNSLNNKVDQHYLENQKLLFECKTIKDKMTIEVEAKEASFKLELERVKAKYANEIRRMERLAEDRSKEIDQLIIDNQNEKNKVLSLEKKLLLQQANSHTQHEDAFKDRLKEILVKLKDREEEINKCHKESNRLEVLLVEKNAQIKKYEAKIKELQQDKDVEPKMELNVKEKLEREIKEKNARIDKLEEENAELKVSYFNIM